MQKPNNQKTIDIEKVAKLADLDLKEEEKTIYGKQLEKILGYISQLEEVDTTDTQPTFNASLNKNITRKDEVSNGLTQEEALKNSSAQKDGYFVTKGVFEEE